jgi:hypothetical protein
MCVDQNYDYAKFLVHNESYFYGFLATVGIRLIHVEGDGAKD